MYRTDKELTPSETKAELDKVLDMVCALSNNEVLDKMRFNSHCEEIGYEVRNQLYRDGLIALGDGMAKIV